ncbi:MFS general substrate transporter [Cucurbitaria berberidis CBS 394.84]|uniref:MFS general substrate transporter n=1 Tax=Cucurbitaria berberidis CBS 394.84 TaxID=1168544 RepID=A0A9P4G7N8_9PLEO|nr:MFS general substrate transporter [Cucurbitaria berberidis CBS 394.84]KAF1840249.1 MFS general substrate transporter [Cucurbitaria berberidis CBS 394.84]
MDSIAAAQPGTQPTHNSEKKLHDVDIEGADAVRKVEESMMPDHSAQKGIRNVEAVTLSWTKTSLACAFVCMWFLYLTNGFQSNITSNLTPYVTSDFQEHSLITVISVVSNSMAAAAYIPVAKLLDLWGRAEGFACMVCLATLGMILMATCNGIAQFCAAQVFYSIGFGAMIYCVDVITADSSSLKHRGLAFAFTSSPNIIVAFAGSKAAEAINNNISWRWGFGALAIILPFVASPLFVILKLNLRKAKHEGVLHREPSGRTMMQSIIFYFREFDVPGAFLLAAGLVIFLLPFTLATSAPSGWSTGYIIAMLVVGFFLLISFGLHERFTAQKPFLPYELLTSRSVLGACLLCFTYQISYYAWNSYFTSFLQVVTDLTIAEAGYVNSTFDVLSGVLLLTVGFIISKTGYFRWLLFIAVPLYILGQGLMIYFRHPNTSIGYIVMCQIFISVGGAIIILCEQIAVMAAADHQHIAPVLALLSISGLLGGAVGNTISGAIWTNSFPQALQRLLPEDAMESYDDIYGSLETQLSYAKGTATRIAIEQAYGIAQKRMLIAGTVIIGLALVWIFMIKNFNVARMHQTKGLLF